VSPPPSPFPQSSAHMSTHAHTLVPQDATKIFHRLIKRTSQDLKIPYPRSARMMDPLSRCATCHGGGKLTPSRETAVLLHRSLNGHTKQSLGPPPLPPSPFSHLLAGCEHELWRGSPVMSLYLPPKWPTLKLAWKMSMRFWSVMKRFPGHLTHDSSTCGAFVV